MEEKFGRVQRQNIRDNWLYRACMPDYTPVPPLSRCPRNSLTLLHFSPVLLCPAALRTA